MTQKEIKKKIMSDLGLKEHQARVYAKMFTDRLVDEFHKSVSAITYVLASENTDGNIRVSYEIAHKRFYMIIQRDKPFSKKKNDNRM